MFVSMLLPWIFSPAMTVLQTDFHCLNKWLFYFLNKWMTESVFAVFQQLLFNSVYILSSAKELYSGVLLFLCLKEYSFLFPCFVVVRLDWDLSRTHRSHIFTVYFYFWNFVCLCPYLKNLSEASLPPGLFCPKALWTLKASSTMHFGTWSHTLSCRLQINGNGESIRCLRVILNWGCHIPLL